MLNIGIDFDEYDKLENKKVSLIKKDDLPVEFGDEAYNIIVDFIQKTRDLDYEWVIIFDYVSGEILKCVKGISDEISFNFDDDEFNGYYVASIHNHPEAVLSPPSYKNFKILKRKSEDYELIAGFEYFWILKAKGLHEDLIEEFNEMSRLICFNAFIFCLIRYQDDKTIDKMHDARYGGELSKYINNKNINDIQLTKKEYVDMTVDLDNVEYGCQKRITNPELLKLLKAYANNPFTPSPQEMMYYAYKRIGMDVNIDEIFAD